MQNMFTHAVCFQLVVGKDGIIPFLFYPFASIF